MTKTMKIEIITYCALKGLVYFCSIFGSLGILGFAGGLQWDRITIAQFLIYEICAFGLLGLAYVLNGFSEFLKLDIVKRDRQLCAIAEQK